MTESQVEHHVPTTGVSSGRSMSTRNMGLRVEIPRGMNSARTSLATLIPPSAASTVTLFEAESIFEPIAQSTPHDDQKVYPHSRKYQAAAMQTAGSCRSSIVYIKSDEKPSKPVIPADRNASPMTLVASAVKPLLPKASTLQRKSSTSANRSTTQSGGLRSLSLLKDRDLTKEGDVFKLAGTQPLVLVLGKKKQKLKVTRDENVDPNSGDKYLKPLQLRRSESSKMRGMLRRDEILPTVIVRPPSTNAKMGSPYEYR